MIEGMSNGEGGSKPTGYFSRAARAQRSEAWQRRRAEAAVRRAEQDRDRQQRETARDRRLQPMREHFAARLAALPPRTPPAVVPAERPATGRPTKARKRTKAAKAAAKKARRQETLADKWRHKREGTPETHEKASFVRQGALARLYEAGDIDKDQLAWSQEIAQVAEQIEQDVQVRTASFETRVDQSRSGRDWAEEGYRRVIHHMAYTLWRGGLPQPRRAILDMIIEELPYSSAARRHRIGRVRAKRLLIAALDRWPECIKASSKELSPADLAAYRAGLV